MKRTTPSYDFAVWQQKTDADIWQALKEDNKQAFEFIYQQYIKGLYNYGMKTYYDDHVITELIQDLYVEIWQRRHNQSKVENIKLYLFKSLRYKIFRTISQIKKFNPSSLEDLPEGIKVEAPVEDLFIAGEDQNEKTIKIAARINQLPDRQREVINLLFYENYSYEDIAMAMGINVRSVYTLTWKAVSALRKMMTELVVLLPVFLLIS